MRNIVLKIRLIRLIRRQNQLVGLFKVDSRSNWSNKSSSHCLYSLPLRGMNRWIVVAVEGFKGGF